MAGDLRAMCLGSAYFDTKLQDRRLQRGAGSGREPVSDKRTYQDVALSRHMNQFFYRAILALV